MEIDTDRYTSVISSKIKQEVLLRFQLNEVPLSAVDIKRKLGDIDISQVSSILKELEDNDLIQCVNPKNKRNRFYELTQDGNKIMSIINEQILQVAIINSFKNIGFQVEKKSQILGPPIDVIISKKNVSILFEFKNKPIQERDVNRIYQSKKELSANRAILVTIFRTSKDIEEFAYSKNIEIWGRRKLDRLQGRILYPRKVRG